MMESSGKTAAWLLSPAAVSGDAPTGTMHGRGHCTSWLELISQKKNYRRSHVTVSGHAPTGTMHGRGHCASWLELISQKNNYRRSHASCGGFWSLATPTLDEHGAKTLVQWEASTTFLEQYVDVAVMHTISSGGYFTKLQDDNPDESNIICHHLIRRKLFVCIV
jgi:hypothetical protein